MTIVAMTFEEASRWIHTLGARCDRLEEALRLIAEGTACPELFPNEVNDDALAAKTAMTIAIAALEVSDSAAIKGAKV